MKSPFPGMDPYLEAHWPDVRISLLLGIRGALQPVLPKGLRARAEEQVMLGTDDGEPLVDDPQIDRFLKIIDVTDGNRIVTAIEVLSPWNKAPGRWNEEYRRRSKKYAETGANLVEIDLLRSPRNRMAVDTNDLPANGQTPYFVMIRPATDPEQWGIYPIELRAPLPWVSIPLRASDAPAVLKLQPLIDRAYASGGYDDVDYSKPTDPPLSPEDEAWADDLLRQAGRR